MTYNNGSAYTFTWEGRQMQTAAKGNTTWTYTYNADGLRIGKTNGTTTYTYTWNENRQLSSMTWNTGYALFYYDADGIPYAVQNYDAILDVERTYLYVTSLQGDVLSIIDASSGATAVTYTYDAWGRLVGKDGTSSDYASIYEYNPLTYRGYIYDSETGFYYLQSRYYDPTVGRFLNADNVLFLGISGTAIGWNLFAYCLNSPVNQEDPLGTASYQNSYKISKVNGIDVYVVTTVINIKWKRLTYKYRITLDGLVKFDFDENSYWSLLWRGGGKVLAEAIYKQARAINKDFLSGRTIRGLNVELLGHWAAYLLTKAGRVRVADMGSMIKGKGFYDSNAWVWESGNLATRISGICIFNVWGYADLIRDIMRYI